MHREADFLLLRRTTTMPPLFRGLWRNLTTSNVFEFKGPTVSPRRGHLESLVEVGFGIERRLRSAQDATADQALGPHGVSFWYLANRLSPRFVDTAESLLGVLEPAGEYGDSQIIASEPKCLGRRINYPPHST